MAVAAPLTAAVARLNALSPSGAEVFEGKLGRAGEEGNPGAFGESGLLMLDWAAVGEVAIVLPKGGLLLGGFMGLYG
jgi:hypothetical protein